MTATYLLAAAAVAFLILDLAGPAWLAARSRTTPALRGSPAAEPRPSPLVVSQSVPAFGGAGARRGTSCTVSARLQLRGQILRDVVHLRFCDQGTDGSPAELAYASIDGLGLISPHEEFELCLRPTLPASLRCAAESAGWRVARGWTPRDRAIP